MEEKARHFSYNLINFFEQQFSFLNYSKKKMLLETSASPKCLFRTGTHFKSVIYIKVIGENFKHQRFFLNLNSFCHNNSFIFSASFKKKQETSVNPVFWLFKLTPMSYTFSNEYTPAVQYQYREHYISVISVFPSLF